MGAGEAGEHESTEAAALYQKAAALGDAHAHLRLGYLAEVGDGVPQDYTAARFHYQTAVDSGLNEARLRLAVCHLEGWGGPVDRSAFVREITTAAEAGYLPAQRVAASMYFAGVVVPIDRKLGMQWMERATAQDDAGAQYYMATNAERLLAKERDQDLSLARTWHPLSAEQEYFESMRALARGYLTGEPNSETWRLGLDWLKLADEMGDAEAPYILAFVALLRPVTTTDPISQEQITAWLRRAADRGNYRALETLEAANTFGGLAPAMRHVLKTPQVERYLQRMARAAPAASAPNAKPQVISMVKPIYPSSLRMTNETGKAMVSFVVDTTGRVAEVKIVSATHPLFGDNAVAAVSQWRFLPGRREGRRVNTRMQVPISFSFEDETIRGIDALLQNAHDLAERLSPEAAADAVDLRIADPVINSTSLLPAEMQHISGPAIAVILIVIDDSGHPQHGYLLKSQPESFGQALYTAALKNVYHPVKINGTPPPASVVLFVGKTRAGGLNQKRNSPKSTSIQRSA